MVHDSHSEHVRKAISWLMLGVVGGLLLDLFAKELLQTYSLQQFILIRSLIAILLLLSIAPRFGGLQSLRTDEKAWHLLRTVLAIGAMFGFFYGLSQMPLVNALTLGYTAPLMMTALSALFLREPVGWRRWAAVSTGFVGTLIMLRPGSGAFSFAAFAVLVAAFCYACQAITARRLSSTESTLSLSFYVVVGPLIISLGLLDGNSWMMPDRIGWILLFGAGVSSVLAWIGLVNGYRAASPALLAPFEYTALVGGAIAGYLIWDEKPDRWVVIGALIIVASGIFVVYRGRAPVSVDVSGDETRHL
ncbi:MAG: DMT family transporter [Gammaproteobacteria bacterium]|nr:DMT family transporter [Gammaproteobacteria bacterium]MBU2675708.1 DMT family transporter [Gammaproteobacteria bacterium]NNC56877.1 DMT family transporter [Woeseiaceae bacterium]NNL49446.1 DMT family transporter [Woeseiaceae bacterium]